MSQSKETGSPNPNPPKGTEEALRAELDAVKEERDAYRAALLSLLPVTEVEFTKEEIFAQRGKNVPLDDFLNNLEAEMKA